jgi:hypothetical protein
MNSTSDTTNPDNITTSATARSDTINLDITSTPTTPDTDTDKTSSVDDNDNIMPKERVDTILSDKLTPANEQTRVIATASLAIIFLALVAPKPTKAVAHLLMVSGVIYPIAAGITRHEVSGLINVIYNTARSMPSVVRATTSTVRSRIASLSRNTFRNTKKSDGRRNLCSSRGEARETPHSSHGISTMPFPIL